jgi:hypothetical protein
MIHRYEDAAFLQDTLLHNINSHGYLYDLINSFQGYGIRSSLPAC